MTLLVLKKSALIDVLLRVKYILRVKALACPRLRCPHAPSTYGLGVRAFPRYVPPNKYIHKIK